MPGLVAIFLSLFVYVLVYSRVFDPTVITIARHEDLPVKQINLIKSPCKVIAGELSLD